MADLVGRVGLCLCFCFCAELALFTLFGMMAIGKGTAALGDAFLCFAIGSVVIFPTSFYYGWQCTKIP